MFGWYQKLNLRWKIRLPLLLLVIVVVYMGYYSMATSQMLGSNAITIAKVNLPEIELLIQADRDLYQALVAERALLQLDNASTSKLVAEQSDNAQQAYDRIYKSLDLSNTATSVEREEFTRRYKQWRQLADEVMRDAVNPERRAAAQEKSYGAAADAFEHVRTYIDELQEKRLAHIDEFTVQIDQNQDSATRYLLISAVIGSLVSLGAAFFLPVIVANQVSQISDRIQNIAEGDGDLTIRIPVDTQDELGQLASHVNRFMEKLQRIIASV
ncbi:MAG TPA: HAMP domain-containing protein, partial [Cellvibrio sp.]